MFEWWKPAARDPQDRVRIRGLEMEAAAGVGERVGAGDRDHRTGDRDAVGIDDRALDRAEDGTRRRGWPARACDRERREERPTCPDRARVPAMRMRHLLTTMLPLTITTCRSPDATRSTLPNGGGGNGPTGPTSLDALTEGAKLFGFTAAAVYLDDGDKPIGARFVHDATRFTLDYLRVETAPQGFIWVTTFPTSDKGEPHTQEHLLLGKGDRGRKLGSSEAMALAESSAFTAQWRTAYHFHTVAGQDVFWPVFENHLDAMVNPDYTDEEIRREVRNFGVDKADDGTLQLEEKGTVYQEMVRTYENPDVGMWRKMGQLVYGPVHPLALDSGGHPDAIRTMTTKDIRTFHENTYHLANMGMIAAFPSTMPLASVLDQTGKVLAKLGTRSGRVWTEADLPKPAPAPGGTIEVVEYPYSDPTNPGPMMFAWPATRKLDDAERLLLGLFLDAFAGDESTTLYKKLIDSKTRVMDVGANAVWSYMTDDLGQPVFVGLTGVRADRLDARTVADVRALVTAELERIAKLPAGDPELAALTTRVQNRVIDLRRRLGKFLDSPPGFGFRGTGAGWMDLLQSMSKSGGFQKSLTMRPALARIGEVLATGGNVWSERLKTTWGLLETPFAVAARPSPSLRKSLDDARKKRIDDELARLGATYGTKDPAATLARYQQEYDAETKKLDEAARATPLPPLVSSLPMTLDDGLVYKTGELGSVKTFEATFDSMAGARVQLSFRLNDRVDPADFMYLGALPALLSDAGLIVDGTPMPADEVREVFRKAILELSVYLVDNDRTGRAELVIAGAGAQVDEARVAIGWIRRVLFGPDWRVANLPRLRDLIDQRITGLRARMLGAEEGWVDDPRDAWRHQSALQAHVSSFLTQMHDLHRIRWQLMDPGDAKVTAEAAKFLARLGEASKLPRKTLGELATALEKLDDATYAPKAPEVAPYRAAAQKLSAGAKPIAKAAGKDLAALLADLPDGSLAADWQYLAKQMATDLQLGAPKLLARLEALRAQIVQAPATRLVQVGSSRAHAALAGEIAELIRAIPTPQHGKAWGPVLGKPIRERVLARDPSAKDLTFVGLVAPGTSSGVFLNLAPATWYGDTSDDAVLDYLASNLYTGHGGHSLFMKTWAAGLAYSNGVRPNIDGGVLVYYAERTPLLPTTMKFVIAELGKAQPDPNIARYAVATAFYSRVASSFEGRASAMAANLVDGQTPDLVKAFRTRVLEVAKQPDLAAKLFARMKTTYGRVLPGYGDKPDPSATYFVIGPEKQLAAWEDYLRATYGTQTKLHRLYPRDFWLPST
jgi:Zn-dependent M16 (insulinase) family peptidase